MTGSPIQKCLCEAKTQNIMAAAAKKKASFYPVTPAGCRLSLLSPVKLLEE
jgi:hypothetical protein